MSPRAFLLIVGVMTAMMLSWYGLQYRQTKSARPLIAMIGWVVVLAGGFLMTRSRQIGMGVLIAAAVVFMLQQPVGRLIDSRRDNRG